MTVTHLGGGLVEQIAFVRQVLQHRVARRRGLQFSVRHNRSSGLSKKKPRRTSSMNRPGLPCLTAWTGRLGWPMYAGNWRSVQRLYPDLWKRRRDTQSEPLRSTQHRPLANCPCMPAIRPCLAARRRCWPKAFVPPRQRHSKPLGTLRRPVMRFVCGMNDK
jgi:hypothetical protein